MAEEPDEKLLMADVKPASTLNAGESTLRKEPDPSREAPRRQDFRDPTNEFDETPRVELRSRDFLPTAAGGSSWGVTRAGGLNVTIGGGKIFTQGYLTPTDPFSVASVSLSLSNNSTNYVYVSIGRSATTRELSTATLSSGTTVPTSTNSAEYHILAVVVTSGGVVSSIAPVQSADLRILETLIVVNGELKYAPLVIGTTNHYDLP